MNEIEKVLKAKQAGLDHLEVPDELEARLRDALHRKPTPTSNGRFRILIAALILMLVTLASNYDVIAYYGKQLLGYEQIMNGTLQQLSDLGKGQTIGKSHTFSNGVSLTLDYVMLDENQLLLFYTLTDPSGHVSDQNVSPFMKVKGFWREYNHSSSQGEINEDETEIKYIASFESPFPFERKLSLKISLAEQGNNEPGQIDFTLNRNTAMGHSLKVNLNEAIQVDETEIKIESILATPTKTVIKGSLQNVISLVKDHFSGERFRPKSLEMKLIVNGNEISQQGGGMSTDQKGMNFHSDFDALPLDLQQIQIKLVSFAADHDVNETYQLNAVLKNQVLEILNQRVEILEISQTNAETRMTISSEEGLTITQLYLMIDGVKFPLEETINDDLTKQLDGRIMHERTLRFLGAGKDLELTIQRMTYAKNYNTIIDVPVK